MIFQMMPLIIEVIFVLIIIMIISLIDLKSIKFIRLSIKILIMSFLHFNTSSSSELTSTPVRYKKDILLTTNPSLTFSNSQNLSSRHFGAKRNLYPHLIQEGVETESYYQHNGSQVSLNQRTTEKDGQQILAMMKLSKFLFQQQMSKKVIIKKKQENIKKMLAIREQKQRCSEDVYQRIEQLNIKNNNLKKKIKKANKQKLTEIDNDIYQIQDEMEEMVSQITRLKKQNKLKEKRKKENLQTKNLRNKYQKQKSTPKRNHHDKPKIYIPINLPQTYNSSHFNQNPEQPDFTSRNQSNFNTIQHSVEVRQNKAIKIGMGGTQHVQTHNKPARRPSFHQYPQNQMQPPKSSAPFHLQYQNPAPSPPLNDLLKRALQQKMGSQESNSQNSHPQGNIKDLLQMALQKQLGPQAVGSGGNTPPIPHPPRIFSFNGKQDPNQKQVNNHPMTGHSYNQSKQPEQGIHPISYSPRQLGKVKQQNPLTKLHGALHSSNQSSKIKLKSSPSDYFDDDSVQVELPQNSRVESRKSGNSLSLKESSKRLKKSSINSKNMNTEKIKWSKQQSQLEKQIVLQLSNSNPSKKQMQKKLSDMGNKITVSNIAEQVQYKKHLLGIPINRDNSPNNKKIQDNSRVKINLDISDHQSSKPPLNSPKSKSIVNISFSSGGDQKKESSRSDEKSMSIDKKKQSPRISHSPKQIKQSEVKILYEESDPTKTTKRIKSQPSIEQQNDNKQIKSLYRCSIEQKIKDIGQIDEDPQFDLNSPSTPFEMNSPVLLDRFRKSQFYKTPETPKKQKQSQIIVKEVPILSNPPNIRENQQKIEKNEQQEDQFLQSISLNKVSKISRNMKQKISNSQQLPNDDDQILNSISLLKQSRVSRQVHQKLWSQNRSSVQTYQINQISPDKNNQNYVEYPISSSETNHLDDEDSDQFGGINSELRRSTQSTFIKKGSAISKSSINRQSYSPSRNTKVTIKLPTNAIQEESQQDQQPSRKHSKSHHKTGSQ